MFGERNAIDIFFSGIAVVFLVSLSVGIFVFAFHYFNIEYPLYKAKNEYLMQHPELIPLNEWQRGGELPEVNVNLKTNEDQKA